MTKSINASLHKNNAVSFLDSFKNEPSYEFIGEVILN